MASTLVTDPSPARLVVTGFMMGPGELTVSSIAQDALSDFSEGSRDEIREMFGPDVYQERFRVDRSKLERMIQGRFLLFYINHVILMF